MIDVSILAGVVVLVSSVLLVFGCVCHLFKRGPGFKTFENDLEEGFGNTIFSPSDTSDVSQVVFETIPDIIAKSVTATALRPRISCTDPDIQKQCAKRVATYKAFPRSHIKYIKEMGVGWFGQVLVSEAYNMDTSSRSTRVVVKMMKDDADSTEQQLFLQDLSVYRELNHPNILRLLGQCTEALPFLAILEYASLGSLKSYLRKEQHIVKTMKKGTVRMQFLTDMAAGLECLHTNGYLHHDFACRNCVVMSDMTVKIGDYYGVAEDHFREDYYDNGQDLLPIRWMAPGSITLSNSLWQVTQFNKLSDIWSFGIAMYEVTEYGEQPYKDMSDEMVLQNLISPNPTQIQLPVTEDPVKSHLYEIMRTCWNPPPSRPSIETLYTQLHKLRVEKDAADEVEFERKWAKMSSREARVVKVEVHASDIVGLKHNIIGNDESSDFNCNSLPVPSHDVISGLSDPVLCHGNSITDECDTPIRLAGNNLTSTPLIPERHVKKFDQKHDKIIDSNSLNSIDSSSHKKAGPQASSDQEKCVEDQDSVCSNLGTLDINHDKNTENQPTKLDFLSETSSDKVTNGSFISQNDQDSYKQNGKGMILNGNNSLELDNSIKDSGHSVSTSDVRTADSDIVNSVCASSENENNSKFEDIDSVIDFEKNYGENHSYNMSQNILPMKSQDQIETLDADDGQNRSDLCLVEEEEEEEEDKSRLEQLKQLKLTLTGVLPSEPQNNQDDQHSGKSSPTSDDMEFAREIYLSKGMSCPPSKYTSTRSLNTILEDELLCEEEIPKPKPEILKEVVPLEESNASSVFVDTFEWDDYIGDQLVGQVETSAVSSRKSMNFSDWTMDSSHGSDMGNDSHNDSGAIFDKKMTINTSTGSPDPQKVKTSPSSGNSMKSPKTPLGSAAQSYVKHILSKQMGGSGSFYSFSHGIDLEDEALPSPIHSTAYNPMDDWDL